MTDSVSIDLTNDNESKWEILKIDNKKYLLSVSQDNGVWKVLLTNLVQLWMEQLTQETILQRCTILNPSLDVEAFDVEEFINDLLTNIPKYATELSTDFIHLSTTIYGGVFKFHVKLSKGNPHQFWQEVMVKLCQSVTMLQYKYNILLDIVKKKDIEIAEYKAEGAQLIRKNIETEPFDLAVFNQQSLKNDFSTTCLNTIGTIMNLNNYSYSFKQSIKQESHNDPLENKFSSNTVKESKLNEVNNHEEVLGTLYNEIHPESSISNVNELENEHSITESMKLKRETSSSSQDDWGLQTKLDKETLNKRSNNFETVALNRPVKKAKKSLRNFIY